MSFLDGFGAFPFCFCPSCRPPRPLMGAITGISGWLRQLPRHGTGRFDCCVFMSYSVFHPADPLPPLKYIAARGGLGIFWLSCVCTYHYYMPWHRTILVRYSPAPGFSRPSAFFSDRYVLPSPRSMGVKKKGQEQHVPIISTVYRTDRLLLYRMALCGSALSSGRAHKRWSMDGLVGCRIL